MCVQIVGGSGVKGRGGAGFLFGVGVGMFASAEAFFDVLGVDGIKRIEQVGGGADVGVVGVIWPQDGGGYFFNSAGVGVIGIVPNERVELRVAYGFGDLHSQIEKVRLRIDRLVRVAEKFGRDAVGFFHLAKQTLDLTGGHHFIEDGRKHGRLGKILVHANGRAEVDEPDALIGDNDVVESQIEVNNARVFV